MALPKLNTPTHRLVLPSTSEEVKFRPFLVKEQKLLLMAQQSDDEKETIDNMIQMIENCTSLNVTNLPVFDVEYLFLKIRAKSVGDIIQLNLLCPDDGITYVNTTLDLNDVEVQIDETHKKIIDITDDVKMIMKYPQMADVQLNETNQNEVTKIFETLKVDKLLKSIKSTFIDFFFKFSAAWIDVRTEAPIDTIVISFPDILFLGSFKSIKYGFSGTCSFVLYKALYSKKITGSFDIILDNKSPFASEGDEGIITFRPGKYENIECNVLAC